MPYKDPIKQRQAQIESASRRYHAPDSKRRDYHRKFIAASRKKKAEKQAMDARVQAHDKKLREDVLNRPSPLIRAPVRMLHKPAEPYSGKMVVQRG